MNLPADRPWQGVEGWFIFQATYQRLFEECPPKGTFIEVGVFHGQSLLFLHCMEREDRKGIMVIGVEVDEINARLAQRTLEQHGFPEAIIIHAPSVEASKQFADGSLDTVFIDANHREGVRDDILFWSRKVKPGGTIAGHDYAPGVWPDVVNAVNELIPASEKTTDACWIAKL